MTYIIGSQTHCSLLSISCASDALRGHSGRWPLAHMRTIIRKLGADVWRSHGVFALCNENITPALWSLGLLCLIYSSKKGLCVRDNSKPATSPVWARGAAYIRILSIGRKETYSKHTPRVRGRFFWFLVLVSWVCYAFQVSFGEKIAEKGHPCTFSR